MNKRTTVTRLSAALLTLALLLSACDLLGGGTGEKGTLRLLLTDAPFPFDLVSEANVTIERVEIVRADEGKDDTEAGGEVEGDIEIVTDEDQSFNLLDLRNGVTALLSEVELEAGRYAQIRLIVRDAEIVLTDGQRFDLKVPSGSETGIKVLLTDFEIAEDALTELTLDFDVSQSFVVQGNVSSPAGIKGFLFTPVIKPINYKGPGDEDDTPEVEVSTGQPGDDAAES